MVSTKRLFVVLWPDQSVRRQVQSLQNQLSKTNGLMSGRVAFENLHLTLRFLGDVPSRQLDGLRSSLARIHAMSFPITLTDCGLFTKAGILWIGPGTSVKPLQQLQRDVAVAVSRYGKGVSSRQYIPHLSLFRKVSHMPAVEAFEPIEWHIEHFVLVESNREPAGVTYRVLDNAIKLSNNSLIRL